MLAKSVKHLAEVRLVLIFGVAKHQNIVQIHQNKVVNVPMHNEFMRHWKVLGALHSPSGKTVY